MEKMHLLFWSPLVSFNFKFMKVIVASAPYISAYRLSLPMTFIQSTQGAEGPQTSRKKKPSNIIMIRYDRNANNCLKINDVAKLQWVIMCVISIDQLCQDCILLVETADTLQRPHVCLLTRAVINTWSNSITQALFGGFFSLWWLQWEYSVHSDYVKMISFSGFT